MQRYVELRRRIEALSAPEELRLAGLDDFSSQDVISRAAQVPALLIIATDEWRERLRSELAPLQALDSLLSVIPEKYHRPLLQNQLPAEAVRSCGLGQKPGLSSIPVRLRCSTWARTLKRKVLRLSA